MKHILIALGMLVLNSVASGQKAYKNLEQFRGATIQYSEYNFAENKARYIGKSVATVLDEWKLPIKRFIGIITDGFRKNINQRNKLEGIYLDYLTPLQTELYSEKDYPYRTLAITFSPPHMHEDTYPAIVEKGGDDNWTQELYDYLKDFIVEDILLVRYPYEPPANPPQRSVRPYRILE